MYQYIKGAVKYLPFPEMDWTPPESREFTEYKINPRPTRGFGTETFSYAGKTMVPEPWPGEGDPARVITGIKDHVELITKEKIVFCLAAYYPDGEQDCPWHSDTVSGDDYIIANVSLGAPRIFQVRYNSSDKIDSWVMEHGDVLIMRAPSQEISEHQVPTQREAGPRISLTMRNTV